MKDYIDDHDIIRSLDEINIADQFRAINIDGYIYRGGNNKYSRLSTNPLYFSSKVSASEYVANGRTKYLKKYETIKPLKLLIFSSAPETIQLCNQYWDYIMEHADDKEKKEIAMTRILIQIVFGMIDGRMDMLNMFGYTIRDLIQYIKNVNNKYNVEDDAIAILEGCIADILNGKVEYNNKTYTSHKVVPSRLSIRSLDKILTLNIEKYINRFNYQGFIFIDYETKIKNGEIRLCKIIDDLYFDNKANLCLSSELCIFNPRKNLIIKDDFTDNSKLE